MNSRYIPLTNTKETTKILDTIIRFPLSTSFMTSEARIIRESIPALAQDLLRTKNSRKVVCAVLGTGWVPMPEFDFADRKVAATMYKDALTKLASYLEDRGALSDDLIVA